nr:immunoglobulin heavy chain junction region [Mus musculus]
CARDRTRGAWFAYW